MNIQVDITRRVQWISDRVDLSDMAKDYISFQIKEAVTQALDQIQNIEKEIVVSDSPAVEHGVYKGVRNLECEADSADVLENTNGATLETRIDSESRCLKHNIHHYDPKCRWFYGACDSCNARRAIDGRIIVER